MPIDDTRPVLNGSSQLHPWLPWLGAVGVSVLALVLSAAVAPHIEVGPFGSYVLAFSCTVAATLAVAHRAPCLRGAAWLTLSLPIGALVGVRISDLSGLPAACAVMAGLLWAGTAIGTAVGVRIQHPGHLLVVAVVSSAADLWSVFHPAGPTGAILESPRTLSVLALPWAWIGTDAIEPLLGVGDVMFAALYLRTARSLGLGEKRMALALMLGFALTLGLVWGLERAIPALPCLGLAAVFSHPEARRLPAQDRRVALWAMTVFVLVVISAFALRA